MLMKGVVLMVIILSINVTSFSQDQFKHLYKLSQQQNQSFLTYNILTSDICLVRQGKEEWVVRASGREYPSYPAISPDKQSLILVNQVTKNSTSKNQKMIILLNLQDNSKKEVISWPSIIWSCGWSPNGEEITFVADSETRFRRSLYSVNLSTLHISELTPTLNLDPYSILSWSPDGTEVVFHHFLEDKNIISIISLRNRQIRRLAEGCNPSWSPDGKLIAYVEPNGEKCVAIAPDGTRQKTLFIEKQWFSTSQELTGPLVWSPDMRFIVYHKTNGMKGDKRKVIFFDLKTKNKKTVYSGSSFEVVSLWNN